MQPISLFPNGIVKFPSGCFSMPQHNLSTETVRNIKVRFAELFSSCVARKQLYSFCSGRAPGHFSLSILNCALKSWNLFLLVGTGPPNNYLLSGHLEGTGHLILIILIWLGWSVQRKCWFLVAILSPLCTLKTVHKPGIWSCPLTGWHLSAHLFCFVKLHF